MHVAVCVLRAHEKKPICEKYPYRKHYFLRVLKRVFFSGFILGLSTFTTQTKQKNRSLFIKLTISLYKSPGKVCYNKSPSGF